MEAGKRYVGILFLTSPSNSSGTQREMHLKSVHLHTQAEADLQRERVDALELEKDALRQQAADLRDKLNKMQSEMDALMSAMEKMVPR